MIPVIASTGEVTEVYGRKITPNRREGAPVPDFPPTKRRSNGLMLAGTSGEIPMALRPPGRGGAAGGACDQNNGITVSKPFAAVDFAIETARR